MFFFPAESQNKTPPSSSFTHPASKYYPYYPPSLLSPLVRHLHHPFLAMSKNDFKAPQAESHDIDLSFGTNDLPQDTLDRPAHFPSNAPVVVDNPDNSLPNHKITENIVEDFSRFRDDPVDFLKTLFHHAKGSSWRSYDNYIGQQLYTPGLTDFLKQKTLENPSLAKKIHEMALLQLEREASGFTSAKDLKNREEELHAWLREKAESMVDEMICTFDHKSVLRFLYYTVAQIFARTYHQGVHVNSLEIENLRNKARELQEKRQSLIFLPCHKSHLDYMSIQFICFRVGISLPTVVSGDNLNFAVIGPIIRQVGAMFIRRSFNNDKLYTQTMQSYIETLLANGFNFECFIEGTRSRTGKLLAPKFGILKFILEAILSGRVEDSWMLPVSTQYDKIAEAETYAIELLGKEKKKENFLDFINARKIMSLQMGRVDVRFHKGWSFREFVETQVNKQLTRSAIHEEVSLSSSRITPEMKIRILRSIGYRVLADINKISVVMPTALIGTMLLTLRGRGIGKQELVRRVDWFIQQIKKRGGRVGDFYHPTIGHLVEDGLEVLGTDLVGTVSKNLLETTYFAKDAFKLSYYRNQIIHLFVSEAIVCVSVYFKYQQQLNDKDTVIKYSELLERVQFLSRLFSGEFVYGPGGIRKNLAHTVDELEQESVLAVSVDPKTGEKSISVAEPEIQRGKEIFDFYCFLLWPFLDGFWLALVSLFSLIPEKHTEVNADTKLLWVDEKEFLNKAQVLGKTLYHQGILVYYEAVNKEMLKNALTHWTNGGEGIVIKHPETGFITVSLDWMDRDKLYDFCEHIAHHRRLIRVRKDVPTLSSRMVTMIHREMGVRDNAAKFSLQSLRDAGLSKAWHKL